MAPFPGEDRPVWHWLASGRASALFAVLAGVSLALMSGGTRPVRGRERLATTTGLVVRALLIAALGLLLGDLELGAGGDPHLLRRAVPARPAVPGSALASAVRPRGRLAGAGAGAGVPPGTGVAAADLRAADVRPVGGARPTALRDHGDGLLPGAAVAGLPPRRDGRRPPRPAAARHRRTTRAVGARAGGRCAGAGRAPVPGRERRRLPRRQFRPRRGGTCCASPTRTAARRSTWPPRSAAHWR